MARQGNGPAIGRPPVGKLIGYRLWPDQVLMLERYADSHSLTVTAALREVIDLMWPPSEDVLHTRGRQP